MRPPRRLQPWLLATTLAACGPARFHLSDAEIDSRPRRAYARAGVPEYWIIRLAERDAIVYTEPDASLDDFVHVEHCPASGDLVSPTLPIRLALADLFAGAPDTTV